MQRFLILLLLTALLVVGCAANSDEFPNDAPPHPDTTPETPAPENPDPETPAPEDTTPETPAPEDTTPETPAPENPDPETPAPENPTPEQPEDSGTSEDYNIVCMSFNVLAYDDSGKYAPAEKRAEAVVSFLLAQDCDIVGLQEATTSAGQNWIPDSEIYNWADKIRSGTQNKYDCLILAEESNHNFSDINAKSGLVILYKKDRFSLLESGAYEYTDDTRYFQWAKLTDNYADRPLYVTNTHLAPKSADKRLWAAQELADFWQQTVQGIPLIAFGDYNCKDDAPPHLQALQVTAKFFPCSVMADLCEGKSTVDNIYISIDTLSCPLRQLLSKEYQLNGQTVTMSDHAPVLTTITYK